MHKTYTPPWWRVLQNAVYTLAFLGFLGRFLQGWLTQTTWIGAMILLLVLTIGYFIMNRTKITLTDTQLTVKTYNATKVYDLKNYTLRAYQTQNGANIDCVFYLDEPNTNKEHRIECEMLGVFQFEELLEDIQTVLHSDIPAQKIQTKKGD